MRVFERAREMLAERQAIGKPSRGLAMPFGVVEPDAWDWRVSLDVWDALYEAAYPMAGPKLIGVGPRLFGIRITTDGALPPNSMILRSRLS